MLTAFTAGLLLITISELGDKTFFIAVILSMRHPKRLVFIGVVAALAAMTIISVLMGQVAALLPPKYINYAEITLFIGFGLKLLYDASQMSGGNACDEIDEAKDVVEEADKTQRRKTAWNVILQSFGLTFVAEWGDRTQIATIALAASHNPIGVTVGAILGHTICTAIAVLGGCLIAGRISERTITGLGGILFLIFGIGAAIGG
jgi:putative Ca2+/H+ antiporter (TMEM165/GDT1 family)